MDGLLSLPRAVLCLCLDSFHLAQSCLFAPLEVTNAVCFRQGEVEIAD